MSSSVQRLGGELFEAGTHIHHLHHRILPFAQQSLLILILSPANAERQRPDAGQENDPHEESHASLVRQPNKGIQVHEDFSINNAALWTPLKLN
jgi:hypothetical protein